MIEIARVSLVLCKVQVSVVSLIALLLMMPSMQVLGQESLGPVSIGAKLEDQRPERLKISGVYPHLTTYGVYSQNGAHLIEGHNECGIGAIVPWAGKLWMVNYAPHMPKGSEHKLFSIDASTLEMTVHPESVGGTPAGRMIHQESQQLLIGHHLIDQQGAIRTISPKEMPIRVTAIARHLVDPVNKVYYVDMEGSIWEANVHTLAVERLFKKPVPGWHAKGGYTAQGRLIVSNNGELHVGDYRDLLVGSAAKDEEEAGVLAQYDGKQWSIIERRQFTDITGPNGIAGGSSADEPAWAIGWDKRSLRLKLLDGDQWHTFLLPKASLCNDAKHGWYTEWPRIRQITNERWMLDMHGMFFDFPRSFSKANSSGIAPIGSHLRYVPDFCDWNGQLVLASDETSIQGNELAGQPQSNLWFGSYEDLKNWGPASGYGGPWVRDRIKANAPSDPFLVAGFDRRVLHLAMHHEDVRSGNDVRRTTDQMAYRSLPTELRSLARVSIARGDWHLPAEGFEFEVNQPVTVYLAVDDRGDPKLDSRWKKTALKAQWQDDENARAPLADSIYAADFPAGKISIPANTTEHVKGSFGMPHLVFVLGKNSDLLVKTEGKAQFWPSEVSVENPTQAAPPVRLSVQLDRRGDGNWDEFAVVEIATPGYTNLTLPSDLQATWLRVSADRDCIATAFMHQTASRYMDGASEENVALFSPLADITASDVLPARLYPSKQSRDLEVLALDQKQWQFSKSAFEFQSVEHDSKLAELLEVRPEYRVDSASVIIDYRDQRWRIPKGNDAFEGATSIGLSHAIREVQSERQLANIHGTFYELPLLTNGQPPAFDLMRPVASHSKQITDFCSWNGLLVLAGVKRGSEDHDHVWMNSDGTVGLWFGGIDDLWRLGKPVGVGGPWKDAEVKKGVPSDPYLMTGYDRKKLRLISNRDTKVTLEIDFDHHSGWHRYQEVSLKANVPYDFEFPEGFSAHWIRFVASDDCQATAWLEYR